MVITRRNVSRGGVGVGGAGKLSLRPREGRIAMILFKDVLKTYLAFDEGPFG